MSQEQHPVNLMESLRKDVKTSIAVQNEKKTSLSPNLTLIRERVNAIIPRLTKELNTSSLSHIPEDSQRQVRARIRELVDQDQALLSTAEKGILLQQLLDEVFGFGPLGPLLRDPTGGDICINGTLSVYVKRKGLWDKTTVRFDSNKHLMQTIDKILLPLGLRLDDTHPLVNARLPNGSFVEAACAPVSLDGPSLLIQHFGMLQTQSLESCAARGIISAPMGDLLKSYVKARANIVVSGQAGSGKSRLIDALSRHITAHERVFTIEESSRLRLQQLHWLRLQTRPADDEGKNEVTMRMLVSKAIRMCADRIIVGNCNGAEGYEFLQAVNAGISGCLTTVAANSVTSCLRRFETMVRLADPGLPLPYAREMIAEGVNVIVQMRRLDDGSSRVGEIVEVRGMDGDNLKLVTMFKLERVNSEEDVLIWQHVEVNSQSQFVP